VRSTENVSISSGQSSTIPRLGQNAVGGRLGRACPQLLPSQGVPACKAADRAFGERQILKMAEDLSQEALVRIFHFLPIKDRSRLACVCKNWRTASSIDAVSVKLKDSHVPHYLHVALPDGAAQLQAAGCPIMSLARSADLTWASAATGSLLQSMPSLEVGRLSAYSSESRLLPMHGLLLYIISFSRL